MVLKSVNIVIVCFSDGMPPRIDLQSGSLKKYGYNVSVMVREGRRVLRSSFGVQVREVRTPLLRWLMRRVPKVLSIPIGYVEYIYCVGKILCSSSKKGDIVQLCHPFLLPLVRMLHKRRTRVFYDAFEFYAVMFSEFGLPGRALSLLCDILETRYVPTLDGVACVTSRDDWLKERMERLNPNTVELWNLPSLEHSLDKKLLNKIHREFIGKDLVVYVGGLKVQKGLSLFQDLVKHVVQMYPKAHFLIVGNIKCKEGGHAWLARNGLNQHCTYIPWVVPSALYSYLQEAHVGLMLSPPSGIHLLVGPGNGRKLFTYMAAGLPVLAPKHGSAWDLVTSERIGIQVDTTRAADVAEGVLTLLERRELREEMASRARTLFLERYNWECHETKYIEMFSGIN